MMDNQDREDKLNNIIKKTKEFKENLDKFKQEYDAFLIDNKVYGINTQDYAIIDQIRNISEKTYFTKTIYDKMWQFKNNYNWNFIFDNYVNPVQNGANPLHEPLTNYETNNFKIGEVNNIIAISEGQNDGDAWLGVFVIRYMYYLMVRGWCDNTGWDCQSEGDAQISTNLGLLKKYSITPEEKRRLFGE